MGCGIDLLCYVHGAVRSAESGVASQITDYVSNAAVSAEKWAIGSAMSLFLQIQSCTTAARPCTPLNSGPVRLLEQDTIWFAGFAGVVGLLIAAIRLALERKASAARFALRGMLNLAFTCTAGVAVITLGEQAGNTYARWIVSQALGSGNGKGQARNLENIANIVSKLDVVTGQPTAAALAVPALVTIFVAILAFCGATAQIFLCLVRNAMLGLLAAMLPISAGASTTETGMAWFRKHVTWVFGYLLYGPVAATILAYAYMNLISPNGVDELSGGMLFILSVVALPALMRLVAPMVAQATIRGGSGGISAATGVATSVAGIGVRLGAGGPVGAVAATGAAAGALGGRGRQQPPAGGNS